jgi:hypothetical protein
LGDRIAGLEQAALAVQQAATAKTAATREAAVEFVSGVAAEIKDQARAAIEQLLQPWFLGQGISEKLISEVPLVTVISDKIDGMARFGMFDQELVRRLEKLSAGQDFLDLQLDTSESPAEQP